MDKQSAVPLDDDDDDEEDEDFKPEDDVEEDRNNLSGEGEEKENTVRKTRLRSSLPQPPARKRIPKALQVGDDENKHITKKAKKLGADVTAKEKESDTSDKSGTDNEVKKVDIVWEQMKKEEAMKKTNPQTVAPVEVPVPVKVTQTYDYAGETVVVTKTVTNTNAIPVIQKKKSNLDAILGGHKKPKLSTLEKSKMDWSQFKEKEGIHDELNQHLKSKNSFLDKQAFLQRTDLRQFEKEKEVRATTRKPTSFG